MDTARKILFLGMVSLGMVVRGEYTTVEELKPMERAHEAVDFIKKNFRKKLTEAMAKGTVAAVDSCKIEAPTVAGPQAKAGEAWEIGRTSHKLRNPANAPREWVKPYLEKFSKMESSKIPKTTLVNLGKNHWGYLEPIFVDGMCLNCHGAGVKPEVKGAIRAGYPEDQALGFAAGDFRGLFWAELKK